MTDPSRRPSKDHSTHDTPHRFICGGCHSCGCRGCFESGRCRHCGRDKEDRYIEEYTPTGWQKVVVEPEGELFGKKALTEEDLRKQTGEPPW